MYKNVYFEVSGICNAKCKYCVSGGQASLSGPLHRRKAGQIEVKDFERAIDYMVLNSIIDEESVVHLYNWGEPFLHPKIKEIFAILTRKRIQFAVSTNASSPVLFDTTVDLSKFVSIYFSMPGFSQQSYDKIHGFNFEQIKTNIQNIISNYRERGFTGTAFMAYHLYQFNLWELQSAQVFSQRLNINMIVYPAFFNGYTMFSDYLSGKMEYEPLKNATSELLTYYIGDLIKRRPAGYICPQWGQLAIDEYCNVLPCCSTDRHCDNYLIGNLFEIPVEELQKLKIIQPICRECAKSGQDFVGHNFPQLTSDTVLQASHVSPIGTKSQRKSRVSRVWSSLSKKWNQLRS